MTVFSRRGRATPPTSPAPPDEPPDSLEAQRDELSRQLVEQCERGAALSQDIDIARRHACGQLERILSDDLRGLMWAIATTNDELKRVKGLIRARDSHHEQPKETR